MRFRSEKEEKYDLLLEQNLQLEFKIEQLKQELEASTIQCSVYEKRVNDLEQA